MDKSVVNWSLISSLMFLSASRNSTAFICLTIAFVCCSLKNSFYYLCFRKGFFVLARSMQSQLDALRWRLFYGWILALTKQGTILLDFDTPEVTPEWISIIEFCVHGLTITLLETMTISFCTLNTKGGVRKSPSLLLKFSMFLLYGLYLSFSSFYGHDFILPCFSYWVCNFKQKATTFCVSLLKYLWHNMVQLAANTKGVSSVSWLVWPFDTTFHQCISP